MSNYDAWPHGMKGLFDTTLLDLTGIHTIQNQCISYVVHEFMKILQEKAEHIVLFREIENLPEKILDYLAVEWSLPYYEDTLDRDTKVRLVKEGFNWRKTAGTVAGVENLAKKMFGQGKVVEWYDYGGQPGFFKIVTNAKMIADMKKFFTFLLKKQKNVRSRLDFIEITRDIETNGFTAVELLEQFKIDVPIFFN